MEGNHIPTDLLLNWDKIKKGSKLVPVSSWAMAEEGSKQVLVVGKDYLEITVLLAPTHLVFFSLPI